MENNEATPLIDSKTSTSGSPDSNQGGFRSLTGARAAFEAKNAELSRRVHQKKALGNQGKLNDSGGPGFGDDAAALRESVRDLLLCSI